MPKTKSRVSNEQVGVQGAKQGAKRIARLEKALDKVQAAQAKRTAQLERLQVRANALAARLATLHAASGPTAPAVEPAATLPGAPEPAVRAYCMRDKRMVEINEPELVVLRNGRHALAGTCQECGTHVVAIVGGPVPALNGDGRALESRPPAEA